MCGVAGAADVDVDVDADVDAGVDVVDGEVVVDVDADVDVEVDVDVDVDVEVDVEVAGLETGPIHPRSDGPPSTRWSGSGLSSSQAQRFRVLHSIIESEAVRPRFRGVESCPVTLFLKTNGFRRSSTLSRLQKPYQRTESRRAPSHYPGTSLRYGFFRLNY